MPEQFEDLDWVKFEVEPSELPEPVDHGAEVATSNRILDFCESSEWAADSYLQPFTSFGNITPWIAYQLGCYAQRLISEKQLALAYRVARMSVGAAMESRSPARLYANLLTLGNVLLASGRKDEAIKQYLLIVYLPFRGGLAERGISHLTLGSLFKISANCLGAIYHTETGLRYLQGKIPPEKRKRIVRNLVECYGQLKDAAGALHCMAQLGPGNPQAMAQTLKFNHVEDALHMATRLHSLGEHELAEAVIKMWRSPQKQ